MDTLVIRFMPHHVLSGLRTDPGPAVARQRGDWDRRPDAVCAQRRRTCPVPGAAATPQAQHPEGGCMDHLQHHGWEERADPGGGRRGPGAHPGGGPEGGEHPAVNVSLVHTLEPQVLRKG